MDWIREHWERPGSGLAASPFTVDFAETQGMLARFDGYSADARLVGGGVPFRIGRLTAEHRRPHSGVRLHIGSYAAVIRIWGVPGDKFDRSTGERHFWNALHVVFNEAIRASGLLPLHAAVVVRDGGATALAGPSGIGKSTTLLRTIGTGGWEALAEDLSWLDPETLTVHGWDRGIWLWPDSIDRFAPRLVHAPWQTDLRGKRFLPWEDFGARVRRTARLDRVLILSRDGASYASVPARDALKALWQSTGVPLLPAVREQVAAILPSLLDRVRFGRHLLGDPLSSAN